MEQRLVGHAPDRAQDSALAKGRRWSNSGCAAAGGAQPTTTKTVVALNDLTELTSWVNTQYARSTDNNWAYQQVTTQGSNSYLRLGTNAPSLIPLNAIIVGIEVNCKMYVSATAKGISVAGGIGQTGGNQLIYPTTTPTMYTFGSRTTVPTPYPNSIRNDMGTVAFSTTAANGGSANVYLNSASMAVYWKFPSKRDSLFFGGGL